MSDLIVSVPDHCLSFYSVAEQATLCITWSQSHEDRFSHDVAQVIRNQC